MPRDIIGLECAECERRNYYTTKNTKLKREKIKIRKFCKWCKKYTEHKEIKI